MLSAGGMDRPTTRIRLGADVAWRVLYNAWDGVEGTVEIEGEAKFAAAFFKTRSVMV